jgi:hypothetical protein
MKNIYFGAAPIALIAAAARGWDISPAIARTVTTATLAQAVVADAAARYGRARSAGG